MKRPAVVVAMALLCGQPSVTAHGDGSLRASAPVTGPEGPSPNRIEDGGSANRRSSNVHGKAITVLVPRFRLSVQSLRLIGLIVPIIACAATVGCMYQPPQGGVGYANMRLPPRWEPSMETTLPFRTWMQDLMLWTICTDMTGPQQAAAIISQIGGAARDLARTLMPAEVYNGGVINDQQLDPVSFLLHGLSARFAPLDEENRLRAAQDLLSFTRKPNETVDALISRFDITRQRAQNEGGGMMSLETASLILLRSCGVSGEQFQALTTPFGLRLPTNEAEFSQMCHHLRRMAHIVERHPNNIASGLRQPQQSHHSHAFLAEADTGSSHSAEHWVAPDQAGLDQSGGSMSAGTMDWAFAALTAEASGTDSDTSSDRDEPLPMEDLQGMSSSQADEYLFGQYQQAKKRWRRFSGKPVRSLRRVLKRKGKGKGKRNSYLNIDGLLQQSAYFKGKGKGGTSSGKGFGRKQNPCGRDGEPLRCSTCGSAYHLRARCPRRTETSGPTVAPNPSSQPQRTAPAFAVESAATHMHFTAFESDSSWVPVTPRSNMSSRPEVRSEAERVPGQQPQSEPTRLEEHQLTPDPWVQDADPWMQWLNEHDGPRQTATLQPLQSRWVEPACIRSCACAVNRSLQLCPSQPCQCLARSMP